MPEPLLPAEKLTEDDDVEMCEQMQKHLKIHHAWVIESMFHF